MSSADEIRGWDKETHQFLQNQMTHNNPRLIAQPYGLPAGPAGSIAQLSPGKRKKINLWDETEKDLGKFWKSLENAKVNNNFLQLSEGVYFLKIHRCCITGNPGIDKTVLGFYLLYLLPQQNKTIVYHKACQYPILFNNQHTFCSGNISDFKGYLDNTDVWSLIRWWEQQYDPCWYGHETRIGMFHHLEETNVENLFSHWGEINHAITEENGEDEEAKLLPHWITNHVKQYALKIDLSSW
ncbi:1659_t:CDS:2 [Ambispora gerdemannii]|uniref:1659_t:CDS:1 n=1 Tax=Ambispora gerdemannii TaxID=144530 RepID=A0A9N9G1V8_9GLOM|nr:1659_t:CDS:2 [Ambispora gerdemannii]